MKVGDLIWTSQKSIDTVWGRRSAKGVILEFIPATHPKQVQKIKVLTEGEIEEWILQYCKVVI